MPKPKNETVAAMRRADSTTPCIEMHCAGASKEHNYGSPECSWVLRMGTVVSKKELSGWKNPSHRVKKGR